MRACVDSVRVVASITDQTSWPAVAACVRRVLQAGGHQRRNVSAWSARSTTVREVDPLDQLSDLYARYYICNSL